jgi:hypothetical protein
MQEFNSYTIPMVPFYLVALLVGWSLFRKEKWLAPTLLALSFSSLAVVCLFVRNLIPNLGHVDVVFSIAMYASPAVTISFVVFGWYLGKKVNLRTAIIVSIVGLSLNFLMAYAYQYMVRKNVEDFKTVETFDCSKLPFHCAIRDNRLSDIPALKNSGINIEEHDPSNRSALWYGINNESAVKVLLENGANPESFNQKSETPLAYVLVISFNPNLAVARLLIKHGAQINRTIGFRKKVSILNLAIINKNIDVINFALENGADSHFVDGYKKDACQRLKKMPMDQITNLKKHCPELFN